MNIKIKIGGTTLIGPDYRSLRLGKPARWGNCFDLVNDGVSHRVVNFSYENFEYITNKLKLKNINVEFLPKSDHLYVISDERISNEWYSDVCTVCTPIRMLPIEQRKRYLEGKTFKKCFDIDGNHTMTLIRSYLGEK